jgi:hypothetical protein
MDTPTDTAAAGGAGAAPPPVLNLDVVDAAPDAAPQPLQAAPIVIRPDGTVSADDRRRLEQITGVEEQYIYQCMTGRKQMEPAEAIRFEAVSGVPRWLLRKHDWWRIWPEITLGCGAPPVPPEGAGCYLGLILEPPPRRGSAGVVFAAKSER